MALVRQSTSFDDSAGITVAVLPSTAHSIGPDSIHTHDESLRQYVYPACPARVSKLVWPYFALAGDRYD